MKIGAHGIGLSACRPSVRCRQGASPPLCTKDLRQRPHRVQHPLRVCGRPNSITLHSIRRNGRTVANRSITEARHCPSGSAPAGGIISATPSTAARSRPREPTAVSIASQSTRGYSAAANAESTSWAGRGPPDRAHVRHQANEFRRSLGSIAARIRRHMWCRNAALLTSPGVGRSVMPDILAGPVVERQHHVGAEVLVVLRVPA